MKKYSEEKLLIIKAEFNEFRKLFGGTKRGNDTEFEYFQKHKDWEASLPLLLPAVKRQIFVRERKRKAGEFVPYWKNLKTWIHNRCWEEEEGSDYKVEEEKPPIMANTFFKS